MKLSTLIVLLIPLCGCVSQAATYNAATANLADVQAAVNLATNGDTVNVPAGTSIWTNFLSVNNDIQLIGAGIGQTVIYDGNTNRNVGGALTIQWIPNVNGGPCRLSGFTFAGIQTNNASTLAASILIQGTNNAFRMDHNYLSILTSFEDIYFSQAICGVVDHNQFEWTNGADFLAIENGSLGGNGAGNSQGWGDVSWATPVGWGTTNQFLYFENNGFYFHTNTVLGAWAICDSALGSRFVFRYNNCTNCWLYTHGTDSSGRIRGFRAAEIYMNNFVAPQANVNAAMVTLRSGTAVIFSNTISGAFLGLAGMGNYRSGQFFNPWGGANGLNPWDSNNPSIISAGSYAGTNGGNILYDNSYNWTIGQWTTNGYEIVDVSQDGTNWLDSSQRQMFGVAQTNDAHSITLIPAVNWGSIQWTNGDVYRIYQVIHALDQVGSGSGDLVQDSSWGSGIPVNSTTGRPSWVHQTIEPLYQWGNTLNGTPDIAIGYDVYNGIQLGRDYINNLAKPGYAPLTYPHPLVSTNAPPTISMQPTSQTAFVGQSVTFSVAATGATPINYQWFTPGYHPGATGTNFSTGTLTNAGVELLFVTAANAYGTTTSSIVTLTVLVTNYPPVITAQPQSLTVLAATFASFGVTATGTAPLGYQWFFQGVGLTNQTASTLAIPGPSAANAGNYYVIVTNIAGSATSSVAGLTVTNLPNPVSTLILWPAHVTTN